MGTRKCIAFHIDFYAWQDYSIVDITLLDMCTLGLEPKVASVEGGDSSGLHEK